MYRHLILLAGFCLFLMPVSALAEKEDPPDPGTTPKVCGCGVTGYLGDVVEACPQACGEFDVCTTRAEGIGGLLLYWCGGGASPSNQSMTEDEYHQFMRERAKK